MHVLMLLAMLAQVTTQPAVAPEVQREVAQERAAFEAELRTIEPIDAKAPAALVDLSLDEDGLLSGRPAQGAKPGLWRASFESWPGLAQFRMPDLPEASSAALIHRRFDVSAGTMTFTDVFVMPNVVNLSRSTVGGETVTDVQFIQSEMNLLESGTAIRLRVNVTDEAGQSLDSQDVTAGSMQTLFREHSELVSTHLRPILIDLGYSELARGINRRLAMAVLAPFMPVDEQTRQTVAKLLTELDGDFPTREAAQKELESMGLPAALAIIQSDRTAFTPEQRGRAGAVVSAQFVMPDSQVSAYRDDPLWLIDILLMGDRALTSAAITRLEKLAGKPINFDPAASLDAEAARLTELFKPGE